MASTQLSDQQQQPAIYQPALSSGNYHGSGSVGPFFAVIAVITVLAALSCVLGRVCAARVEGLDSSYNCLQWMRWGRWRCRAGDVENGNKAVDTEANGKPQENEEPQPTAA